MASTQQIKRRIRSVKSTKQITKAMELVAASKLRRAQEATLKSRAFSNTAREILMRIRQLTNVSKHELYKQRKVNNKLYIVISGDRGLAGAYNSNVLKVFSRTLSEDESQQISTQAVIIGKKGSQFASKLKGLKVIGVYENFPDVPTADDLRPISELAADLFVTKQIDAVDVIFTNFLSSIKQEVMLRRILPAAFQETEIRRDLGEAIFEPSPDYILDMLTPRLVEAQLQQAFLEAAASEHSMRMLAMKNATDNASELIDDLTLEFNSARQAAITQELAEITSGAEAIK